MCPKIVGLMQTIKEKDEQLDLYRANPQLAKDIENADKLNKLDFKFK